MKKQRASHDTPTRLLALDRAQQVQAGRIPPPSKRMPQGGSMPPPPAARTPAVLRALADPGWQKLWLTLSSLEWWTLALLPAGSGNSAVEVAELLYGLATTYDPSVVHCIDLRKLQIGQIDTMTRRLHDRAQLGERVLAVLAAPHENPTTARIVSQLDAAVLCVTITESRIAAANKVIEEIGRDRFLGTIVVEPNGKLGSKTR